MAELLIKASDATNPDEVKDLRGCYKKGDVVVVKPDGWKWGKEESKKEKFYILKVTDKSVEDLKHLTQPDEINIGSCYIAESPELGIATNAMDETTAVKDCQSMAEIVMSELNQYGLAPTYQIKTRAEDIKHVIARRKKKLDIDAIEKDLQTGPVELTSDKLVIATKKTMRGSSIK